MSDQETAETEMKPEPTILIPIPGGGVARLPIAVLKQYRDESAQLGHPPESMRDVSAHNLVVGNDGNQVWHQSFEWGLCEYVDQNGFPRQEYAYHNHPFGTEYTEIYPT